MGWWGQGTRPLRKEVVGRAGWDSARRQLRKEAVVNQRIGGDSALRQLRKGAVVERSRQSTKATA